MIGDSDNRIQKGLGLDSDVGGCLSGLRVYVYAQFF